MNELNKLVGKCTTEVIKTLAYQYKRRKDQLSTISDYDKSGLRFITMQNFNKVSELVEVEILTNETAKKVYNVDLDNFNETFDFFRRRHLLISSDNNNSPLLPGFVNLQFRAWHDYLHFDNNYPFDFVGEFLTYEKHIENGCSETVKKILFSEIVLQACYFLTFGHFPEVQKVVLLEDYYIDLATELVYFNSPKN